MKVLINENTENKLHSFYQNKIDDEWNVLKQRYKDEEVSSGNWYLSYINVIDRIKVTMVKVMSHRVLIFVDVYDKLRIHRIECNEERDRIVYIRYMEQNLFYFEIK